MTYTGVEVVFYALAAAASPLVLAATFVVIGSERPRRNGIAFLSGFVFGTVLACGLGLVLGQAAVDELDSHETVKAVVTLLLGLALLAVGLRSRGAPSPRPQARGSRATAILAGLGNVGPAATCSMAGLLGFGGPKRLVLTFLAMTAVSESTFRDFADLSLVVVYIVIATLLVSVPVSLVIVAGDRAAVIISRGQSWLTEHALALRVWLSLVIGGALVLDALAHLFT